MIRQRQAQYRAVVRFSIFDPQWRGWRASRGAFAGPGEYRDWLWAPQRMQNRIEVFGRYAAPIYQQIAERHDFRVLVQHSEQLPRVWADQLAELAARHPVLRLVPVPGLVESRDTVHDDLRRDGRTGPVVMLRVDDDDLISADFVDLLSAHVTRAHHGWCISLGQGLAARLGPDGITDLRMLHSPLIAIGQAFVGGYRRRGHRLDLSTLLSHRQVPRTLPTIVDSRSVAFIHVRHVDQDSRLGGDLAQAEQHVRAGLDKLPPIEDPSGLREKFPTLADRFEGVGEGG